MSDLHALPLRGHDIEFAPFMRGRVYAVRQSTGRVDWFWHYTGHQARIVTAHGPFPRWHEAYTSCRRMVELL